MDSGERTPAEPCADQELSRKACSKQSVAKIGAPLPYSPGIDLKLSWNFFVAFGFLSYRPLIHDQDLKREA